MAVDSPSMFAQVIQDHLELKRRNSALEHEMPLGKYMHDDPFENHPLFKTEEQARIEDTMDGVPGHRVARDFARLADDRGHVHRAPQDDSRSRRRAADRGAPGDRSDPDERSDENLWSRSRDFDWGD